MSPTAETVAESPAWWNLLACCTCREQPQHPGHEEALIPAHVPPRLPFRTAAEQSAGARAAAREPAKDGLGAPRGYLQLLRCCQRRRAAAEPIKVCSFVDATPSTAAPSEASESSSPWTDDDEDEDGVERTPSSSEAMLAAKQLEEKLDEQCLASLREVLSEGETVRMCLVRFLRARDFRFDAAEAMLREDIAWRLSTGAHRLLSKPRGEVAGVEEDFLWKNLPVWHQGFDRQDRPLIFKHYGKTNLGAIFKQTTLESMHLLHIYENERVAVLCGQQSHRLGREISKATFIIDAAGWTSKSMGSTSEALSYAKGMARVDQDHYPERLGCVVIVNAPYLIAFFWRCISAVIDEKTRKKVQIFSTREQWEPVLLDLVDADQLPKEYGGRAEIRQS